MASGHSSRAPYDLLEDKTKEYCNGPRKSIVRSSQGARTILVGSYDGVLTMSARRPHGVLATRMNQFGDINNIVLHFLNNYVLTKNNNVFNILFV